MIKALMVDDSTHQGYTHRDGSQVIIKAGRNEFDMAGFELQARAGRYGSLGFGFG
jgi:hypothetical protein